MSAVPEWVKDYSNVICLGDWLILNDRVKTARDLQRYYEAPYDWSDEWAEYQAELQN